MQTIGFAVVSHTRVPVQRPWQDAFVWTDSSHAGGTKSALVVEVRDRIVRRGHLLLGTDVVTSPLEDGANSVERDGLDSAEDASLELALEGREDALAGTECVPKVIVHLGDGPRVVGRRRERDVMERRSDSSESES